MAEALAERQVLADLIDGTKTSIMAFDTDHRILAIDRASAAGIERVCGRRPRVGDDVLALLADRPERRAQVAGKRDRALGGEEFTTVEEFGDAAHERVTYEVRLSVLRDRDGRQVGAFRTALDVSGRVRAQAEPEAARRPCARARRWRPRASSPRAWRTTSTTCRRPSSAPWTGW